MDIKTISTTISSRSGCLIFATMLAFGIGCGGGGGPEDTHTPDIVTGDVITDTGEVQAHDEGIADMGRDEQSAETGGDTAVGDTAGDVDALSDAADADQDAHVPSGVVEVLPEQVVFACSMAKKFGLATLTVKNVGDAGLSLTSISIADPGCDASSCLFSITNLRLYDPDGNICTGTGPIEPGGFVAVELKFEMVGPNTGNNSANLEIVSDSTVNPLVIVPMNVTIIEAGACRLQMFAGRVDFGIVPVGFPKTSQARFVNSGTGECTINSVKIADCNSNGEAMVCPDPLTGEDSTVFTIPAHVDVIGITVGPGQAASMPVVYTPPVAGEDTTTYSAMLSVDVADLAGEGYVLPSCGGETGVTCTPHLAGAIVLDTNVYPQAVDFGKVRSGCGTAQARICYYNTADPPLPVKVDASQCGTEFVFEDFPEDWDDAFKGVPWCVQVDYRPADGGTDQCAVLFNENRTPATSQEFTLTGEGSTVDGVTDTFAGHSGQTDFDIRGMPVAGSVVVKINDFECDDWSVGGTDLDATIVLGESCPVQHLDEVLITYDLDCVVPLG